MDNQVVAEKAGVDNAEVREESEEVVFWDMAEAMKGVVMVWEEESKVDF